MKQTKRPQPKKRRRARRKKTSRRRRRAPVFRASARACANIALAKYWGKSDVELNLPAVPSISMTLDGLVTETQVSFEPWLDRDVVHLDGRYATGDEAGRVVELLDRVREAANLEMFARVVTENHFPTASGLASSASGFAALAAAGARAAGLAWSDTQLSRLARRSSASAARSIFGGFAELPKGRVGGDSLAARALFGPRHWDLRMVLALTAHGRKKVGSTEGMERSRKSSPYYDAWLEAAPKYARRIKRALRDKHLDRLGRAMEQSTLAFHACAMAADPGVLYWQPGTLAALATVRRLREDRGLPVYVTMDAGPHVKVLCRKRDVTVVRRALGRTDGVLQTMACKAGPGVKTRRVRSS